MERYSKKSKIKRIKTEKGILFAEIISNPSSLEKIEKEKLTKDIRELVTKCWGDFGKDYIENNIINSYLTLVIREDSGKNIALGSVKKLNIRKRIVYGFGMTVVDPEYRGIGLMKKIYTLLLKKIFKESLKKLQYSIEVLFITPNIQTIASIAKVASFVYPNPYKQNIVEADEETWETVKEFLKKSGENYRKLNRAGCIMEGFYDDKPELIFKGLPNQNDPNLENFSKKYLHDKPGKEVVVRAKISIFSLLKHGS